jgi:hypothetical protein
MEALGDREQPARLRRRVAVLGGVGAVDDQASDDRPLARRRQGRVDPEPSRGGPRLRSRGDAQATSSVVAPVMIATASDIEWVCGVTTATRLPSRMM